MSRTGGFTPPPYPYDRLAQLRAIAERHDGGAVDCSVGTPCDPTPPVILEAMARSDATRGYPPSAGTPAYREAAAALLGRAYGAVVAPDAVAACVGTKEFVSSLAHLLSLRDPSRDVVLVPAIAYPTYAVSAQLADLEAVGVDLDDGHLALERIAPDVARRALVLWANSPSNPTGRLDDLAAAAAFGRRHGIVVASDECYADFTWRGSPSTVLQCGPDGVLAVHSVSKRSNLAGARAGFYAGDPELVDYLKLVRQHAGLLVAGPVQAAAVASWSDDAHVTEQRGVYRRRLDLVRTALVAAGFAVDDPEGTFYLWARLPGHDGWAGAGVLAERAGLVASPGDLYGAAGRDFVRVAMVQPDERLALACDRLARADAALPAGR